MTTAPEWVSFTDRLAAALEEAAADKSKADEAEAILKVAFSQMVVAIGGPVAKAEHEARASQKYVDLSEQTYSARTKSNMSAAKVKGMEYRLEAWRTAESTRRAEIGLK